MFEIFSQNPSSSKKLVHIQHWLCSLFDLHNIHLAQLDTPCYHSSIVCSVWHLLHHAWISWNVYSTVCVSLYLCVLECVSLPVGGWGYESGGQLRATESLPGLPMACVWLCVKQEVGGVNSPGSSRHLSPLARPLWQWEGDQVSALIQRALMPECCRMSDLQRTPSVQLRVREKERGWRPRPLTSSCYYNSRGTSNQNSLIFGNTMSSSSKDLNLNRTWIRMLLATSHDVKRLL